MTAARDLKHVSEVGDPLKMAKKFLKLALLAQAPCVKHAELELHLVTQIIARALLKLDWQVTNRIRQLGMSEAIIAVLAAFESAVYAPVRFVGGCDDARGLDASGNEWGQLGGVVMARDTYTSRHMSRVAAAWENDLSAVRKQRLEDVPGGYTCPNKKCKRCSKGKVHAHRYVRNHVYLTARSLASWHNTGWLRPLVSAIRSEVPTRCWIATDAARAWRKGGIQYRDTLTTSRDDLRAAAAERTKALAKQRHRGATSRKCPIRQISPTESALKDLKDRPGGRAPVGVGEAAAVPQPLVTPDDGPPPPLRAWEIESAGRGEGAIVTPPQTRAPEAERDSHAHDRRARRRERAETGDEFLARIRLIARRGT